MTSFEHAMLGVTQVLATGLHHRYGWQLAAMAGAVALSPDWDGLTLVCGINVFDQAHRAWGHNLFVATVVGASLAILDYRYDLAGRAKRVLQRILRDNSRRDPLRSRAQRTRSGYGIWFVVGILVALTHLAADLVFSGTATLSDWHLRLLWPFSDRGFVFPLVPWGDVGTTVVFVAAMFAMWRWPSRSQWIAIGTLTLVAAYLAVRGLAVLSG
jgi:hypothetical protein